MKTSLVGGLLLFGLAGGQSHGSSVAPACVVDCTKNMANQTAEGMRAVCHNVAKQRALFHCLLNACPSQSYGYALGYTISACSDLGARISPLHPIEVHHVAPAKRQNIPTEPGPVLPSPSTLHGGQILTFDHKFAVALDCNAGTDGLVTLSVPVPDSAATPVFDSNGGNPNPGDADRLGNNAAQGDTARQSQYPQQGPDGRNTYMEDPDCELTTVSTHSHTVAGVQRTGCPCESSSSSTWPWSTSTTLFQSPAEQQSGYLPLSTTTLSSSWFPSQTSRSQTEDCEDTSLLANSTTTTAGYTQTSSLLGPVTQRPGPVESTDCSEFVAASVSTPPTTSATTTLTTTSSTSGWSTSTLTSSLSSASEDPCTNSSSVYTTTSSTSTSSSSWYSTTTTSTSTSCTEGPTSSTSCTKSTSMSTRPDVTDCTESSTSFWRTQDSSATASLHEASTNVTSVSSTQSSWTTASTTSTSLILTTGPPAYTTLVPPTPPAYLPPLAQYSYGNPPMYSSLSASMPTSTVPRWSSTSTQTTGPGVFGSQDTTTTGSTSSTWSSIYPESYAPSSSTLRGPAPTRTQMAAEPVDGLPFGLSAVPDNSVGGEDDIMGNRPSENPAALTSASLVEEGSPIGTRSDLTGASAAPPAQVTEGTTAYDNVNNAVLVTIISPDAGGEVHTTVIRVHENAPWATTAPRDDSGFGPDALGNDVHASSRNDLLFALANSETGDQERWQGPVPETTFIVPGPGVTGTFVRSDHTVSEMEATPTAVTAGSNGLRPSFSIVCAAIFVAILGVMTTTVS